MAAGDIVRWISNSSTDWATGANWSPSAPPGADEIGLFDGQGQADVAGGDESTATAMRRIVFQREYRGSVGTNASPLIHNILTVNSPFSFLTFRGTGDFHFQGGGAGAGQQDYSALIDAPGSTISLAGDANSDLRAVHVKAGNVTISSNLVDVLTVSGNKSNVTLGSASLSPRTVRVSGGLLTSTRTMAVTSGVGSISVVGGKWIQDADVSTSLEVYIGPGGWWDFRPASSLSSGAIHLISDGVLDLSNAKFAIAWVKYVLGPSAREVGTAKQGGISLPQVGGTQIDLREEYP